MSSFSLTCYLTEHDADKLVNRLRGKVADEDIKEALKRLDRLTQDELRNVAAQTFGVVSSEQTHSACNLTSTECPFLDVQASVDSTFVSDNKVPLSLTNFQKSCPKWRTM